MFENGYYKCIKKYEKNYINMYSFGRSFFIDFKFIRAKGPRKTF